MRLRIYLLALAVSHAVTAADTQQRGVSFRPARVDPADTPSPPPTYHSSGDDVPHVGGTTHLGDDIPESTTPEYQPAAQPNECLREECAELTAEIAGEVIKQLVDNLGGSSSTSTIGQLKLNGGFGTQVQQPVVTAYATRSLIPNLNVAKTMTLDQDSLALFNADEQGMYSHDRMCFYANVERRYASAAAASPTTQLAHRDVIDAIQSAETASPAPLASTDAVFYQEPLWNTLMPDRLLSIYAPVTANGSMTTSTTTCSGLGGAPSITMSYIQARVSSSSPTPTANDNMVEGAANMQAKAGSSAVFGAVVALFGLVIL